MSTVTVPKDWKLVHLAKVAKIQTGLAKGKKNLRNPVSLPYLRVANVQDGRLELSEIKFIDVPKNEIERYSLKTGDVLLTEGGDNDKLGRGTVWRGEIETCLHQNHIFVVRPNPETLDPYFLSLLTGSPYGKLYFRKSSKQSTNLASINTKQLSAFPVLLPHLDEQYKIVEILSTWDEAIVKTERLLAALRERKKGLMQRLLTGQTRFPGFDGEWTEMELGEFLKPIFRKVEKPKDGYLRLGIRSHGKGTFTSTMDDADSEAVAMTHLFQVKEGDLIVSITFAWEGAIAMVGKDGDGALVSHRFPTYTFDTAKVLPEYFRYLMLTKRFFYDLVLISPGGAGRNRVMSKTDFLKLTVKVPSIAEQKKIGGALVATDEYINALSRKLELLQQQKKGLMQRLLTGQVRVQI